MTYIVPSQQERRAQSGRLSARGTGAPDFFVVRKPDATEQNKKKEFKYKDTGRRNADIA